LIVVGVEAICVTLRDALRRHIAAAAAPAVSSNAALLERAVAKIDSVLPIIKRASA
jgi:hypothetical protein